MLTLPGEHNNNVPMRKHAAKVERCVNAFAVERISGIRGVASDGILESTSLGTLEHVGTQAPA